MEKNTSDRQLRTDRAASNLVEFLESNLYQLGLHESQLYFEFPILKDLNDLLIISKLLIISRQHGIIAISTSNSTSPIHLEDELHELDDELEHLYSLLFSRLVRNKVLRNSRTELAFPTNTIIYAPFVTGTPENYDLESQLIFTGIQMKDFLERVKTAPLDSQVYEELVATVEGAKGLIRPKAREVRNNDTASKASLANKVETEIASFDQRQKQGFITPLDGLQRIRGLAGSGKTVVLAMKAALTHLREPDSYILYTFHTKSLYQHIRRLITRFYRQFEDKDPDWTHLKVMHGWGGHANEGVLFNACVSHDVEPMTFSFAAQSSKENPFGYACKTLLKNASIHPMYDYAFIDEGQDFPAPFIQLCLKLTDRGRVVFAYDDLQTIFQATTPSLKEIVGADKDGNPITELSEDTILYKCYRNPREIIVCAHALGFGLYGTRIVQMLENREQWEDVGYKVKEGDFLQGSRTVIERPAENSLTTISTYQRPDQIVQAVVVATIEDEIAEVVRGILADLEEGLRPDDILVVIVDDRHVATYINSLMESLANHDVYCNNIHSDKYGIKDFHKDGFVTLSTVHKAKGNEAYMVYVMGIDALYSPFTSVRERNVLFTAMTRAKGWVRVTGVGEGAAFFKEEIDKALMNFPNLVFDYPSREELKILKRDLTQKDIRKLHAERQLDILFEGMSQAEIETYLAKRVIKKIK